MTKAKRKRLFTGFVVLMVLFMAVSFYTATSSTRAHEQAHAQTCKYFGGVPNITYSNFGLNGETLCSNDDSPDRHLADSLIEGFGYQTQAYSGGSMLFSLMIFSVVMIILARDMTREETHEL